MCESAPVRSTSTRHRSWRYQAASSFGLQLRWQAYMMADHMKAEMMLPARRCLLKHTLHLCQNSPGR